MRIWFITGATRGLGLATTRVALAAGDAVVATGRDVSGIATQLPESGDRLLACPLDIAEPGAADATVAVATERFGRIDVLVNNAGYGQLGVFEETSAAAAERQFQVNVFGTFGVTRAVLPVMRRQRAGHVFTISSIVGFVGAEGASVYSASKFAVAGWAEALSREVKPFGIRVTLVYPGYFRTDFLDDSSMRLGDLSIADYAEATRAATERRRGMNHRQAGDPAAFGRVLVTLAGLEEPPVHFAAGSDALTVLRGRVRTLDAAAEDWADHSASTDLPDEG